MQYLFNLGVLESKIVRIRIILQSEKVRKF